MNKQRKVELLYRRAQGESLNISPDEAKELSKYKVSKVGKTLNTKTNLQQYVTAVDKGYRKTFYDWCLDNNKGDGRRKDGRAEDIRSFNRDQSIAVIAMGWLMWGVAIYWIMGGSTPVGTCAAMGAVIAFVLYRMKREAVGLTCILLPIILAVIFGRK